jgi:cytochrome P450
MRNMGHLPDDVRKAASYNDGVIDIDNALNAWGSFDRDDPFPLFARVRAEGPVQRVTLADGHDAWLVMGHAEARAALNDPRVSKDMQAALALSGGVLAEGLPGRAYARHMLAVDPPDHTRLRRLVASAFSVRRVEALEGHVQRLVDEHLDAIAARGPDAIVDLVESYAFPLPFTVICELLGVPEDSRASLGRSLSDMLVPTNTPEEFAAAKAASDQVVTFLEALVDDKRREPDDALVSALIDARDGDETLDEQELRSTIFQLIIAGHDTTSSLIGNGVVALLTHPEELASVRTEPELIANAVEELIRYDAPVPHSTFRYAPEEMELGGVTIPAGAQIIVNLASANRDGDRYDLPDALDVGRSDVRHLGFGHGIHFCLGAPLARMEGRLALGGLFARFPDLRLAVPVEDLHWGHGDGLVLRGLTELPVVPGVSA